MRDGRRCDAANEHGRRSVCGNGALLEYTFIQRFADLEAVYTCDGVETVHSLIAGRAITGVQMFSR